MLKNIGRIALYSLLGVSLLANAYLYNLSLFWFNFAKREYITIKVLGNSCGLSRVQQ